MTVNALSNKVGQAAIEANCKVIALALRGKNTSDAVLQLQRYILLHFCCHTTLTKDQQSQIQCYLKNNGYAN